MLSFVGLCGGHCFFQTKPLGAANLHNQSRQSPAIQFSADTADGGKPGLPAQGGKLPVAPGVFLAAFDGH